jgi:hypothetical protein
MRIRTIAAAAAAPAALAGILLGTAGQASAAVQPASLMAYHAQKPAVASASVELSGSGYEQYAQVNALQGFGRNHGTVDYTNWQYAAPGTGVWAPVNQVDSLSFQLNGTGTPYVHQLNSGLKLQAVSPTHLKFSGSGEFAGSGTLSNPQYSWTIKGDVRGDRVSFTIDYNGSTYAVTASGLIAANGSATGTAIAVNPAQNLTWTLPAGAFASVLHYIAPVQSDTITVKGQNATVTFKVPAGVPFAGTPVTWQIHNGGAAAADTWAQNGSAETVEAGHIQILP